MNDKGGYNFVESSFTFSDVWRGIEIRLCDSWEW